MGLERLETRLVLIAAVVALGVWDGVATWVVWEASGVDRDIVHQICVQTLFWLYWLPLVPAVFEISQRIRKRGVPAWLAVFLHGIMAIGVSSLHLTGMTVLAWYGWNQATGTGTLPTNLAILFGNFFVYDFAIYAVVVVSFLVVRAERERAAVAASESALREAKLRAEMQGSEARLRALRMELNPHFLFNVLNDVAGLVRTDRGSRATSMIARLSALLRTTLHRSTEREVPLSEEVALLRTYVEIERMRFEDRLQVEFGIPPELEEEIVPPFILQPLVENAIHHGLGEGVLRVRIAAALEGDALVLAVSDDGPGFPPRPGKGIGLQNVEERLRELYGPRGRLALGVSEWGGAQVAITLPAAACSGGATPTSRARR